MSSFIPISADINCNEVQTLAWLCTQSEINRPQVFNRVIYCKKKKKKMCVFKGEWAARIICNRMMLEYTRRKPQPSVSLTFSTCNTHAWKFSLHCLSTSFRRECFLTVAAASPSDRNCDTYDIFERTSPMDYTGNIQWRCHNCSCGTRTNVSNLTRCCTKVWTVLTESLRSAPLRSTGTVPLAEKRTTLCRRTYFTLIVCVTKRLSSLVIW